jgi:branched-chain amino acid aminotransferase
VVAIAPAAPPAESTSVAVVEWPRNERGVLAGLKTTSYAENVVVLAHAKGLGATEALFADTQGRLSEGTGSNVFVVMAGQLLTPALSTGCLNGITRQLVLEWTGAREVELPISALDDADELFLTSSIRDVQSVAAIVGARQARILPAAPGPVTREAAALFAKHSAEDPEP